MADAELAEGKTCRKCGEWKLASAYYDRQNSCKECVKVNAAAYRKRNAKVVASRQRAWREANKDRISKYQKRHYLEHREKYITKQKNRYWNVIVPSKEKRRVRFLSEEERTRHSQEYKATWYAANRDRLDEKSRKWRLNNIEKERARCRKYASEHAAERTAYCKKWRSENLDKCAVFARNRRARMRRAGGSHSAADIAEIRVLQKDKCAMPYCKRSLRGKGHVDHIKPLKLGGSNRRSNLQLLCASCNQHKHAKDPIDFARENGLLV